MRLLHYFVCGLTASLSAQATRYVPATHVNVEGNSTNTYPFGRATGGLQILIDGKNLTSTSAGLVMAASFRSNGILPGSSTASGYTKAYLVTCWNTAVPASAMTNLPASNAGSAVPTVVFNSGLNLPSVAVGTVLPEPFSVRIPFSLSYPFDGATKNLLMQVETADAVVPPSTWAVDSISTNKSVIGGLQAKIGTLCTYSSQQLKMTLGNTQAQTAVPGGSISYTLTSTSTGSWPTVIAILGATNASPGFPIDLTPFAMPGCSLHVDPVATQTVLEGVTGYPGVSWPIPSLPTLQGGSVYVQNLGLNTLTSLVGAVTTDAFAVTLGNASSAAAVSAQSIFSSNLTTWSIGTLGAYHPILKFEGVLP